MLVRRSRRIGSSLSHVAFPNSDNGWSPTLRPGRRTASASRIYTLRVYPDDNIPATTLSQWPQTARIGANC